MTDTKNILVERAKWVELFRIQLTENEAYGVRNWKGESWERHVGDILRVAGYDYPFGECERLLTADNQLVIRIPPQPIAIPTLTLEDILTRYQAGTLADENDVTLYEAMAILEKADKAFLDESGRLAALPGQRRKAISERYELSQIAEAIYEILLVRYGCND